MLKIDVNAHLDTSVRLDPVVHDNVPVLTGEDLQEEEGGLEQASGWSREHLGQLGYGQNHQMFWDFFLLIKIVTRAAIEALYAKILYVMNVYICNSTCHSMDAKGVVAYLQVRSKGTKSQTCKWERGKEGQRGSGEYNWCAGKFLTRMKESWRKLGRK